MKVRSRRVVAGLLTTTLAVAVPAVVSSPASAAAPKFGGAAWSKPLGPTHLSSPVIADVNGDGLADIVFGSFDHRTYALNRFGGALAGFPMDSLDTIWDSPALYDAGGIGRSDIFLGGDASPGGPCGNQTWSGIMRAIRVTAGGPHVLWSRCRHQIYQSSPAIGDLDGTGRMALVVGTGNGPSGDALATNSLSAFYLDNGAN